MKTVVLEPEIQMSDSSESTVASMHHSEVYDRCTALCYATASEDIVTMTNLMRAKADVNFQDYLGQTPLHIAAASGANMEVAALLILHEANIHMVDKVSQTPLDLAISSRNSQVEQLLRAKGAKIQQGRLNNAAIQGCWAIDANDVAVGAELSCTLKSRVFRGKWRTIDVVVKYPLEHVEALDHEEADEDTSPLGQLQYEEVLHEIDILQSLRHPNLVLFLGACLQDQPVMFVTEYMPGGDLEQYYQAQGKACTHLPPTSSPSTGLGQSTLPCPGIFTWLLSMHHP